MPDYTYLIVGGGMTADAAIHGIREIDRNGSIGLIGAEAHPPYNRPPLSKGLWKKQRLESIWRKSDTPGVTLHLGRRVEQLDPRNKRDTDDQGGVHTFDRLLLALTERGRRFAVIGGGFIGSEVAAALAMNARDVVMAFPGQGLCSRVFPSDVVGFLNDFYRRKGVEILAGASVVGMEARQDKSILTIVDGPGKSARDVTVDGVVAGIGVQPNVELAQEAGLEVQNGVRVNASLRSSHPDIYAAGDVASFHNPALDDWLRVEHEDNANTMGRMAGRAMAGETTSYDHLPSFYSDLFELGYEAVGEIDSRLETVADWKEPYREGVIYYLRAGRVRGVLLWNVWEQVDAARRLIAEPGPFSAGDLKGRLPA